MQPQKLVWPARHDRHGSVDLFDANRKNELGGPYCVEAGILSHQVEDCWNRYLETLGYTIEGNYHPAKQEAYDVAAAIERASDHRLIALPCAEGNGIAVSDGDAIWFVEHAEVSTPEAVGAHVARWLNTSSARKLISTATPWAPIQTNHEL